MLTIWTCLHQIKSNDMVLIHGKSSREVFVGCCRKRRVRCLSTWFFGKEKIVCTLQEWACTQDAHRSIHAGQRTVDNLVICAPAASEQKFVSKVEKGFGELVYKIHVIILSFDCFMVVNSRFDKHIWYFEYSRVSLSPCLNIRVWWLSVKYKIKSVLNVTGVRFVERFVFVKGSGSSLALWPAAVLAIQHVVRWRIHFGPLSVAPPGIISCNTGIVPWWAVQSDIPLW